LRDYHHIPTGIYSFELRPYNFPQLPFDPVPLHCQLGKFCSHHDAYPRIFKTIFAKFQYHVARRNGPALAINSIEIFFFRDSVFGSQHLFYTVVSFFLPFCRLLLRTFWPFLVLFLFVKPCRLFLLVLFGLYV
jgi:hypothetical protein